MIIAAARFVVALHQTSRSSPLPRQGLALESLLKVEVALVAMTLQVSSAVDTY